LICAGTLRIDNDQARVVASADSDDARHAWIGRCCSATAEIDRGEVEFEGRRYLVTRGSVDFANAARIQPILRHRGRNRVRVRARPTW
jgi:hypothetical protein